MNKNIMKLSELIESLKKMACRNGAYDPTVIALVDNDKYFFVKNVGILGDHLILWGDEELYKCKDCNQAEVCCHCDK